LATTLLMANNLARIRAGARAIPAGGCAEQRGTWPSWPRSSREEPGPSRGLRPSRTPGQPVAPTSSNLQGQGSFGSPGLLRPGRGRVRDGGVRCLGLTGGLLPATGLPVAVQVAVPPAVATCRGAWVCRKDPSGLPDCQRLRDRGRPSGQSPGCADGRRAAVGNGITSGILLLTRALLTTSAHRRCSPFGMPVAATSSCCFVADRGAHRSGTFSGTLGGTLSAPPTAAGTGQSGARKGSETRPPVGDLVAGTCQLPTC
jgi:hypothetical protein